MEIEELIKACIKENNAARKQLYLKYGPILKAICIRYIKEPNEANDVFHDCFIKLLFSLKKFQFQGSFEGWVKKLTANHCLDILKKTKRIVYIENLTDGDLEEQNEDDLEENRSKVDFTTEELNSMILLLPDSHRIIFNMYQIEDFSHKEIANILQIDEQVSRARLSRARKKLKEIIKVKTQEKLLY